jgi:hypothetical protein
MGGECGTYEEKKNAHLVLVGHHEGKCTWEDNVTELIWLRI